MISAPAVETGIGLTVTVTASVDIQLLAVVVTVNVVVIGAEVVLFKVTVGFDAVVLLRPPAGDHE